MNQVFQKMYKPQGKFGNIPDVLTAENKIKDIVPWANEGDKLIMELDAIEEVQNQILNSNANKIRKEGLLRKTFDHMTNTMIALNKLQKETEFREEFKQYLVGTHPHPGNDK